MRGEGGSRTRLTDLLELAAVVDAIGFDMRRDREHLSKVEIGLFKGRGDIVGWRVFGRREGGVSSLLSSRSKAVSKEGGTCDIKKRGLDGWCKMIVQS